MKWASLLSIFTLIISASNAQSMKALRNQSDSFSRVTKNKIWTISKYFQTSKQADKKSLFDNLGFKFSQDDSTKFRITIGGKDSMMGQWTIQNDNNVLFSMPRILDSFGDADTTNSYNKAVKLLCSWPLKKNDSQPSRLAFEMMDPFTGEAIIEFSGKECADCKVNKK